MNEKIQSLLDFLNESKSHYHATAAVARWLEEADYTLLEESAPWTLVPGGKYYLTRGGSGLLAFRIPEVTPKGFLMSASHCDRPTFLVKENGELQGTYTRLATERYGGMLIYSWIDRPLSVAGRVLVETDSGVESRLVDIDRDLGLIPSVAIHMDRNANEGRKWDPAKDVNVTLGSKSAAGKLHKLLEEAAGGKILASDLYLYIRQKATVWGIDEEYISAPGLDDLECVWGCAQGFLHAQPSESIPVLCVFDSEEVGSCSPQGADGTLLSATLARISRLMGYDHDQMLANSFMVSADNAHAIHPNHPELSDPGNAPTLGGGIVIKTNANLSYTSSGLSTAIFRKLCADRDIPTQSFYNRADLRGGSTLGRISLNHVSVPSVDIGLAQLAMHSCYETASSADPIHLENAMTAFYGASLQATSGGYIMK